jgi:phage terminase large subunit-like protein
MKHNPALVYSTACVDWERRIVARESLVPFPPLFPEEAEASLAVFKSLKIVDAPWVADKESGEIRPPTFGETCDERELDFVRAIFGAYDAREARRLINEFFLLISKKNGKSTLAAGIMLTALIRNWRYSAELLILAPTLEVAENCFKPAADMVRHDADLMAFLHVQDHLKTITHLVTKAVLKVVAADSNTVSGKKAAFILVEELWLFGKMKNAAAMLAEATGGLVARPEGFVIYLSTQSDAPPAGVFKDKLDYFRDVRDGIIDDPKSLAVIYEFPQSMIEAEAYLDPANFYITNPNIDRPGFHDWLKDKLRKVLRGEDRDDDRQTFLAKHLNIEIGTRLRRNQWQGAPYWEKQGDKEITLARIIERCEVAVSGIDGGGLDDLLGLAVIGRDKETKDWLAWAHAWAQPEVLERRKSIAAALLDFKSDGDLTICEDETQDVREVAEIVKQLDDAGLLPKEWAVGLDPAGVAAILEELALHGIVAPKVTAVGQGYRLQPAILGIPRKLKNGTFRHSGSRLMAFCVGNAKEEKRGNATVIEKAVAGAAKIDPFVALLNAGMLMNRNPVAEGVSVYQTRGLLVL